MANMACWAPIDYHGRILLYYGHMAPVYDTLALLQALEQGLEAGPDQCQNQCQNSVQDQYPGTAICQINRDRIIDI